MAARLATAGLALALAVVPAGTAPAVAAPDDAIALRQGPPVMGEIVSVGDDHFQVRTGERLAKISFAKVTAESLYTHLKARTKLDDPDARLALSATLGTYGAFPGARAELRAVKALAPSMRAEIGLRLSDLDEQEAKWLYRAGMDHATAEPPRWKEAVEAFAAVVDRFAGLPVADKAVPKLKLARAELAKAPKPPVTPEEGPQVNPKVEKWATSIVAAAEQALGKALAANKAALKYERKALEHKAVNAYAEAATHAEEARTWCAKVLQIAAKAKPETAKAARTTHDKAEKQLVALRTQLAAMYFVQKNYTQARASVLHALEMDPANRRALDLKMTIEKEMVRERPKDDGTKSDKKTVRK